MTDEKIEQLVDRWIAYWNVDPPKHDGEESDYLNDMLMPGCDCDPEVLWRFIKATYKREIPERHLALLAAGPLEDLIAEHGYDYIDRIETEARQNPRFRHVLGGVWRNSSASDVWSRIEAIRGNEVW